MKPSQLLVLASILSLLGTAQARFFVGAPSSTLVTRSAITSFVGLQLGTYDLGNGFGLRAGAEVVPELSAGLNVQGAADLLYTRGSDLVLYGGVGSGYANLGGAEALFVSGTLGVDIDAQTTVSYFLEAQPRYNLSSRTPQLYLRSGINLHLGE
jgi:hypothetical protein